MPLKAKIAKLEDIPGSLRPFYDREHDDGPWTLQVEAVDGLELGEISGAHAEVERAFAALEGHLKTAAIDEAVGKAGGDIALLEPHIAGRLAFDRRSMKLRVIDANGRRAFGANGQPLTAVDVVNELRERRGFERAFAQEAPRPAATNGGGENLTERMIALRAQRAAEKPALPGGNLFAKGATWNLTNQMKLLKADPARAAHLKAQAEA